MAKSIATSWVGPGLLALLFLLPVGAYAAYSVADRWYQNYVLGQEEEMLRREIEQLRRENLRLQAELNEARSDHRIEAIAREQLGLVKPGDRPIVLVGPPATPAAESPPRREPPPVPEKTAWRRLLDAIFGR